MLCDSCGKNDANIHYSQVINDQVTEFHLCEECAEKKGLSPQGFSIGNLISGLVDIGGGVEFEEKETKEICGKCKISNIEFKKTGFLGCSECYKSFGKSLSDLLRRIHGNNIHVGKIPTKVPTKTGEIIKDDSESRKLKIELQKAIETERFEDAAKLRDRIKGLESNNIKNR